MALEPLKESIKRRYGRYLVVEFDDCIRELAPLITDAQLSFPENNFNDNNFKMFASDIYKAKTAF